MPALRLKGSGTIGNGGAAIWVHYDLKLIRQADEFGGMEVSGDGRLLGVGVPAAFATAPSHVLSTAGALDLRVTLDELDGSLARVRVCSPAAVGASSPGRAR